MNKEKQSQPNQKRRVVFVGGETAGPVMPLLTLADAWVKQDQTIEPVFFDLRRSVASRVVPNRGYKFKSITSGKLRRYWTIKNIFSPFLTLFGLIQSLFLLATLRPIIVIGAGGYIQVPVVIAAWILRIPRIIHQQDIVPTFSNRICTPLANKITVTFEKSLKDFPQGLGFEKSYSHYTKVEWTGNPTDLNQDDVTQEQRHSAQKLFKLDPEWPTVLVIGGGSGARGLNAAVNQSLPELLKIAQVVHSTGVGKRIRPNVDIAHGHDRYHQYEFIDQVNQAYIAADVVICRAGLGTITALSALGKLSIVVPMPESHQEWNAQYLYNHKAAIILDETDITPTTLAKTVRKILFDIELQKEMQKNIRAIMPGNGTENILTLVNKLLHEK